MPLKRKYDRRSQYQQKDRYGKYTRKYQTAKNFSTQVKRVLMKAAETKYKFGSAENVSLYHDRGTVGAGALTTNQGAIIFNPWSNIVKGIEQWDRVGDEIYARGFSLRLMCWNAPGRTAQFVRIIIAVIPKIEGTVITDGTNFDLMDKYGSNDTVTGMIKVEGVKVLYDNIVTFKALGSTDTTSTSGDNRLFKRIYVKSKPGAKVSWGQDGKVQNKPVGVWVVPYDEYGSLRSDNILSCSYTYKMYFKDI